jgi:hypothetical protein
VRPSSRRSRDVRPVDLELKLPSHRAAVGDRSPPGAQSVGRGPVRSVETSPHVTARCPAASRLRWRTTFARLADRHPPRRGPGPVSSVLPRSVAPRPEGRGACGRRDSPMERQST